MESLSFEFELTWVRFLDKVSLKLDILLDLKRGQTGVFLEVLSGVSNVTVGSGTLTFIKSNVGWIFEGPQFPVGRGGAAEFTLANLEETDLLDSLQRFATGVE